MALSFFLCKFLVEYNGTKYFFVKPSDADTVDYYVQKDHILMTFSRDTYVVAYDENGNSVGSYTIKAHANH